MVLPFCNAERNSSRSQDRWRYLRERSKETRRNRGGTEVPERVDTPREEKSPCTP